MPDPNVLIKGRGRIEYLVNLENYPGTKEVHRYCRGDSIEEAIEEIEHCIETAKETGKFKASFVIPETDEKFYDIDYRGRLTGIYRFLSPEETIEVQERYRGYNKKNKEQRGK